MKRVRRKLPVEAWHGTVKGYVHKGCRLECCKTAWADYQRKQRANSRCVICKVTNKQPRGTEQRMNICATCRDAVIEALGLADVAEPAA